MAFQVQRFIGEECERTIMNGVKNLKRNTNNDPNKKRPQLHCMHYSN